MKEQKQTKESFNPFDDLGMDFEMDFGMDFEIEMNFDIDPIELEN